MKTVLFDVETTGLNPKVDRIIEIGAMVVSESWQPLHMVSQLVWESGYPAITPVVEEVTGITQAALMSGGVPLVAALNELAAMTGTDIDYVIAHNAAFDKGFFTEEAIRSGLSLRGPTNLMMNVPWLCSMNDIEHPLNFKCRKLSHLALDYGVPVDPSVLHRAVQDVDLMRKMLFAADATPKGMFEYNQTPVVVLAADVSYDRREEASSRGYRWQKVYVNGTEREYVKQWVKPLKENKVEAETNSVPFKVTIAKEKI